MLISEEIILKNIVRLGKVYGDANDEMRATIQSWLTQLWDYHAKHYKEV